MKPTSSKLLHKHGHCESPNLEGVGFLRWCLFFYLILNKILILNNVKYEVICFLNILFLLNIKKIKKNEHIIFLFKKIQIFWFFQFNKKFIRNYKKIKKNKQLKV